MDIESIRRFLNDWPGIIAIIALLLATPLNVAANDLTPKYQNWQAGRSVSMARKRIAKLEAEIRKVTALANMDIFWRMRAALEATEPKKNEFVLLRFEGSGRKDYDLLHNGFPGRILSMKGAHTDRFDRLARGSLVSFVGYNDGGSEIYGITAKGLQERP